MRYQSVIARLASARRRPVLIGPEITAEKQSAFSMLGIPEKEFSSRHVKERIYLTLVKGRRVDRTIGFDIGEQTIWATWHVIRESDVTEAAPPFVFSSDVMKSPSGKSYLVFLTFPRALPNGQRWNAKDVTSIAAR